MTGSQTCHILINLLFMQMMNKAQQEFMNIKYQNKVRLAKYIKEHNGIEVDPRSIFDVQVKTTS